MALASGTKLGPYEIQSQLGAGGMGEVYRARDTRLGRDVAIKVLPAHLSSNPDLKLRLEREARAISALQDPHICALYDIGSQDGTDYLVMELLEGETLAERLRKGSLPLKQALEYGIEIAGALEKAHKNGIVHRDLKPGNIMLTKSGAKLLDFGLAKSGTGMGAAAFASAETMTTPLTGEGKIVGTYQYMAPEQIQGQTADARTDIFALGAVLYEMVTGQRPFKGKNPITVMSAILESEPEPISTLKAVTPPTLDHAIQRCLAKDPEERWQSARDLALELKWLNGLQPAAVPLKTESRTGVQWVAWAIALIAALAGGFLAFAYLRKAPVEGTVVRLTIPPPDGGAFVFHEPVAGAWLSPDGENVAFVARVGKGRPQLWVRPLNSFQARPLPGTEDAGLAFWSPDSRNLGFFAQGQLQRIAVSGGRPQALCATDSLRGASWGRKDVIIFAKVGGGILRVPASGGTPEQVTTPDTNRREGTHRWPSFLPDGNHFVFMAAFQGPVSDQNVFYLASLDGKPARILGHGSSQIAYASGYLLYVSGNVLMGRPFDPVKLDYAGDETPIAEGVEFDSLLSSAVFSVSDNGRLIYQAGKGVTHSLWLLDPTGRPTKNIGSGTPGADPTFSPDGKAIVYDSMSPDFAKIDLWMQDLTSGTRTRLATDDLVLGSHSAIWSKDGKFLAYVSAKTGARAIYIRTLNQLAQEEKRWQPKLDDYFVLNDWTPDHKWLIVTLEPRNSTLFHVALLAVAGNDEPVSLLETKDASVAAGQVSPDGHWIAYRSGDSPHYEIYISSFPDPTGRFQVSSDGGVAPRWRHDGKALYYLAPQDKLMVAELKEGSGSLQVISTRVFSETPQTNYLTAAGVHQYDVARDGSRFVIDSVDIKDSLVPLNVVLNWARDLKK
jgi:eukaryotic-like serine/threonine-protein kinase